MHSLFDLTGKTALVTGASSGLGWRFAEALSQAGASVILAARRTERLEALAQSINANGGKAISLIMDVSSRVSVQEALTRCEEERIDILVNNAGIAKLTPIFDKDKSQDFETNIQTNLMGVWYVTCEVANHMKEKKIEGSIINISSVNGANRLTYNIAAYCAAKAGVIQLTKALAGEN